VSKHAALGTAVLEKSQHIHKWLSHSAQYSGLTLKLKIARGSKLEQIRNALPFLFGENRGAVKIIEMPQWAYETSMALAGRFEPDG